MKIRNIQIDEKRSITLYDDVFSAGEIHDFYSVTQNRAFRLDRTATGLLEDGPMTTLVSRLNIIDFLNFGFFNSKNFETFLNIIKDKNLRLNRAYINLCTSEDIFPYHCDSKYVDDLTFLYYINSKWDPIWEGETHFSNEHMDDILCSSSFKPGRLAVFNANIPHKSSQPSSVAEQFRYTLAIKFVSESNPAWKKSVPLQYMVVPTNESLVFSDKEKKAIEFCK